MNLDRSWYVEINSNGMNVESEKWETNFNPEEHKKIEHKLKSQFVQSVYGKF